MGKRDELHFLDVFIMRVFRNNIPSYISFFLLPFYDTFSHFVLVDERVVSAIWVLGFLYFKSCGLVMSGMIECWGDSFLVFALSNSEAFQQVLERLGDLTQQ